MGGMYKEKRIGGRGALRVVFSFGSVGVFVFLSFFSSFFLYAHFFLQLLSLEHIAYAGPE